MPLFKDLSPLDNQGLMDHRPARETKWRVLNNVIFKDGGMCRRPGVSSLSTFSEGPLKSYYLPSVNRGLPVAIMEINNPGSDVAGREGFKWITETELPDGSSVIVAGWTGDHTDIDESPPDGAAYMQSSTDGAQKAISFTNTSSDFDSVSHLVFRGRARAVGVAEPQVLRFYNRTGGVNYLMGSIIVYGSQDGEEPA